MATIADKQLITREYMTQHMYMIHKPCKTTIDFVEHMLGN